MKGGVVPERLREFETRLASVNRALGGFPLQSQHEGNCASDAIQIVLFFSDGIGRRFARQAIREYNDIRPDIYNEDWITQQLRRVRAGDAMYQTLGDIYARITSVRYLRMIDEYEQRVQSTGLGLARTESQGASIRRGNIRTPIGVLCSSVFAVANTLALSREERERNPDLPRQTEDILNLPEGRHPYYGYSETNYDPIVRRVLAKVAPNSVLVTGRVTEREQQIGEIFVGRYEADTDPMLQRIVGVQLFFYEERTQPGREGRGFHTLSLFKHGGIWYIGDNEVGIAIPLPQNINNTQHILNNKFSFVATVIGEEIVGRRRMYQYQRIFYTHPITANGLLGAGVEISRANYFLTSPTSGTYVHSYENVGSRRTQHPMPRKYFVPPPDEPDVWYGAEPREEPYQLRIFEQTIQRRRPARRAMEPIPQEEEEEAPLEDTVAAAAASGAPVAHGFVGALISTVPLGGYLRNTNPGDTTLWNLIPSSITLYPTAAGAGGAASIQAYAAKFVTNDGIYGIRITQGGSGGYGGITTNYKLNKTQNRQEQYITVNGVDLYLEPIAGAPAARPARPARAEPAAPARPARAEPAATAAPARPAAAAELLSVQPGRTFTMIRRSGGLMLGAFPFSITSRNGNTITGRDDSNEYTFELVGTTDTENNVDYSLQLAPGATPYTLTFRNYRPIGTVAAAPAGVSRPGAATEFFRRPAPPAAAPAGDVDMSDRLGFGFAGTTAAATVTPVTTATPAPTSYGFPTTLGQYYKSTEQAPPGFYVGNTLALANANTNVVETNGLLFFFMTEPSTNDIIAVFRVGEDQYQAYKIARNRSPDTTMVSGNVYLAGIRDPAIMQAAYNRAQEVKREQAAALASAARREEELRFRFPGLSTPPPAPEPRVSGLSDDPFGIRAIHERFAGRGRRTRRARKTRPTRRKR